LFFHDAILVHANGCEKIQHTLVHWFQAVNNESDSNALPGRDTLFRAPSPVLGLLGLADISDVQHHAMQGTCVKGLVLVVGGDGNKNFSGTIVNLGAQRVSVAFRKLIRIAGGGGVPHVAAKIEQSTMRRAQRMQQNERLAYENSVDFVEDHFVSMALKTGVGAAYSAMKFPCVSFTLRVTPRLMVCRRLHALSTPVDDVDMIEPGRAG
jgi:hypothetical protein